MRVRQGCNRGRRGGGAKKGLQHVGRWGGGTGNAGGVGVGGGKAEEGSAWKGKVRGRTRAAGGAGQGPPAASRPVGMTGTPTLAVQYSRARLTPPPPAAPPRACRWKHCLKYLAPGSTSGSAHTRPSTPTPPAPTSPPSPLPPPAWGLVGWGWEIQRGAPASPSPPHHPRYPISPWPQEAGALHTPSAPAPLGVTGGSGKVAWVGMGYGQDWHSCMGRNRAGGRGAVWGLQCSAPSLVGR